VKNDCEIDPEASADVTSSVHVSCDPQAQRTKAAFSNTPEVIKFALRVFIDEIVSLASE